MKNWRRIPFALALTTLWAFLSIFAIDMNRGGLTSTALITLSMLVLITEFYKSGDITLYFFGLDLFFALINTVLYVTCITILIKSLGIQGLFIGDFFVGFVVLADGWFSPVNSFRTALRNWQAGEAGPSSPGDSQ